MDEVRWERLKAHELRERAASDAIVIIPVASIEQHGPHLPVMTDTRIGHAIAVRAARKAAVDGPVVVTPVVWSGLSEHHMAYGGTLTLAPDTFHTVLRDLVGSLVRHGFRRVLISNSHGGNHIAMQHTAETLERTTPAAVVATTYVFEAADGLGTVLEDQARVEHACEAETSIMMVLEPDLVDTSALDTLAAAEGAAFLKVGQAGFRWRPFEHVTPNGVIGNPARATAEKGERLLEIAAEAIAALITDPATWTATRDLRPAT